MAQKKRRGRPPLPPHSKRKPDLVIAVRIPEYLLQSLKEQAASPRGQSLSPRSLSAEIRQALDFWVSRHAKSRDHNSRLGNAVAAIADRVEEITGKSWLDDALTRQVLREHVQKLVSHILLPLSKPVAVPADIKEEAGLILALLKHVIPRPGVRRLLGTVIIDDPALAMISQELNRELGDGRANVETRPFLVARRMQQRRKR